MRKGSFDRLIDELAVDAALAKSLSTEEDDERIAAAADDGEEQDDNLHPSDASTLKVLRQLAGAIKALNTQVVEMRADLDALRGGKPMTKALQARRGAARLAGEEFMAKALSAQAAGRITGVQVAIAEAYINAKQAPPREIVQAVLAN